VPTLASAVVSSTPMRLVAVPLGLLVAATLAGLVLLWPGDERASVGPLAPGQIVGATVDSVTGSGCEHLAGRGCQLARLTITSGPEKGRQSYVALPSTDFAPALEPGDEIRVSRNVVPGQPAPALDDREVQPLAFVDFERGRPLYALVGVFALLVVALARWQGLRSLVGLGLSLVIVVGWMVPSILSGHSPVAAALVGWLAVMVATTALTHGVGLKSAAAILGAAATLVVIVGLGAVAVDAASITGLSSDEAGILGTRGQGDISIEGLVLAGIVIGALGVLDDLTVSQSSTVLALRRASPRMRAGALFREGMVVGRDHLGATVNTLVLAYAGASLPVLLVFAGQGTSFLDAVKFEQVAGVIVATVVGSTGLLAAVPLTTGLAAVLAARQPVAASERRLARAHAH
jgi:uncharacterized membrane protein